MAAQRGVHDGQNRVRIPDDQKLTDSSAIIPRVINQR